MIRFALAVVFVLYYTSISAQTASSALPHVLVYKTKTDYRRLVPVVLSADKTKIVSFPGPGDVTTGSTIVLPVLLHKGYLLDKRGISPNSAFTKYTYEEYSKLVDVPSPEDLFKTLVDKNPLTELYDCGIRTAGRQEVADLNKIIDKRLLKKKCKLMK